MQETPTIAQLKAVTDLACAYLEHSDDMDVKTYQELFDTVTQTEIWLEGMEQITPEQELKLAYSVIEKHKLWPPVPSDYFTKMITLSTAHLTQEVAERLNYESFGQVIYSKDEYGWFVYLSPLGLKEHEVGEPCLWAALQLAANMGCSWVCFDRDGPETPHLQVYEW